MKKKNDLLENTPQEGLLSLLLAVLGTIVTLGQTMIPHYDYQLNVFYLALAHLIIHIMYKIKKIS